jgi:UDP-arabinose 4-epimerase
LELQECGHTPVVMDNLSTGFRELARDFQFVEADISDTVIAGKVLREVDAVIHCAASAYVGESVQNPRKYFQNNIEHSLAFLDAVLKSDVRMFVFSSSCATYGETCSIPIREDSPQCPVNPYGATKLFIEHALRAYRKSAGLRSLCLRYFNAAGADEKGRSGELHAPETHLIPLALKAAEGSGPPLTIFGTDFPTQDGTCVRDFVHVSDLARAHVRALEYLAKDGNVFALNLGTGVGNSILEVLEHIEKVTGSKVPTCVGPRREGDPPILVAEAKFAELILGWKAEHGLQSIIETAWAWARRHPNVHGRHFERSA